MCQQVHGWLLQLQRSHIHVLTLDGALVYMLGIFSLPFPQSIHHFIKPIEYNMYFHFNLPLLKTTIRFLAIM